MPSSRDVCFAAAVDAYNELQEEIHGKKWLNISHQTTWKKEFPGNNRWFPANAVSRATTYLKDKFGLASYQVRYPDITLKMPDGKYMVLDNKFSGDRWGTRPGKHSLKTQKQDYEDINREQGHPMADPMLDPQKCGCDDRKKKRELKPQRVWVPVENPVNDYYFSPYPSNVRGVPRALPRGAPVRWGPGPQFFPRLIPIP